MRLIPTMECKPGMKLAKPIYSKSGHILAETRLELTDRIISRLCQLGYDYLHIEDSDTDDIYIEDSIRMETRLALRITLQRIFEAAGNDPAGNPDGGFSLPGSCRDGIDMLIDDLKNLGDDPIMLIHVGTSSGERGIEHFLQNAINVCVYATSIGINEGLQGKDLMSLCLGALLHDIGNIRIPREILQKTSALTRREFDRVKRHCEIGFDLLKNEPGLPMASALCALMHHERMDGSGYPYGLKGPEIHPFARWIGMVDAYDAMTHPRPYRSAMLPHEAMEVLFAGAGTQFDYEKVDVFRKKVAIFPVGLGVSLNTGEQGIVSRVNPGSLLRPVVRIMSDSSGRPVKPYEIDLSARLNVMIERIGHRNADRDVL